MLFGMAGGWLFSNLGIPYLFKTPEYLNEVNAISYFIMGFVLGFFVMAFHVASYIFYSYRFTFLATLSRPLYRFSINNSFLPFIFYLFYGYHIFEALESDGVGTGTALFNILFLLLGSTLSISLTYSYFFGTARKNNVVVDDKKLPTPIRFFIKKERTIKDSPEDELVVTYLRNFWQIRRVRSSSHYSKRQRLEILQQHHTNAAVFFILILVLLIALSLAGNNRFFMIPAGASLVLMLTSYMMIFGALFSWFKTWTISILFLVLLTINYITSWPKFQLINYAGGMDYTTAPAPYTYEHMAEITTDAILAEDEAAMISALNAWKSKQNSSKPRMIIINSSGGGLRSALFTLGSLQHFDSLTQGGFLDQVFLITGSSGGMIGASYYRELFARKKEHRADDIKSNLYYNKLGRDILNPVGFTMVVNDLFIPLKSYKAGGFTYPVDRGYAFDRKFNENTDQILNKPVFAYRELEKNGTIPLLILAPTMINEGRRLIISPMGLSFLTHVKNKYLQNRNDNYDGIEFSRFFRNQQPDSLSFVAALRMSSTFPYIAPLISLPSEPRIEVIDAGARDNDGLLLTVRFLHAFNDWLAENTSGVTVVQFLAARPIEPEIKPLPAATRFDAIVKPVGGMFSSFASLQLFSRAEILTYTQDWAKFDMDLIQLDLLTQSNEISLSWHLTEREKVQIRKSIHSERLKKEFAKVLRDTAPYNATEVNSP